ncbi:MAG: hypothetical protein ACERIE_02370 [Methyloceanibacter sp.]
MTTSTMPLAERLDCHPVHRATALLHQVLLSPPGISPDPDEILDHSTLRFNTAPTGLGDGAASVTYQASLSALLGLPAIKDRDISCQPPASLQLDVPAPDKPNEEPSEEEETPDGTTEAQLEGLIQAFHRRQQQASLIVTCSVVTAVVLTIGGLALLFNVASSNAEMTPKVKTSAVWIGPDAHVRVTPNRSAKAAPLLIRAKANPQPHAPSQATSAAQVVHATSGHELALAPLLPRSSARYLLLRGLPEDADLSAGRRTGLGAWLVKGDDTPGLALTLAKGASGDYPLDVYQLETGNGPQARHRLILRVGVPQELAAMSVSEADVLRERAQRLLGKGSITAARHLLTEAAEQGHGAAAYELALTYDREVLAKAGIRGIDSDARVARTWYEYAAQDGHAEAGQRLQTLAKRRAAS